MEPYGYASHPDALLCPLQAGFKQSLDWALRVRQDTELRIAAIAELGNFKDEASRAIFEQAAGRSDHPRLSSAGRVALSKLSTGP